VVWSRVFVEGGKLNCDLGLGEAVELPEEESQERWRLTNPEWPMMNMVMQDITRDQFMARHKANHIQVVYAPDKANARKALYAKAAAMNALGIKVTLCGKI
jgi:L-fucose isomerase-like protein